MSNIRKARSSKSALRLADLQETRRKAGFFVIARCQLTPRRGQRSRRGAFGAWLARRRAFGAHPRCSDTPSRFVPERPLPRPMFLFGLRPLHLSGTRLEGGHRRLFRTLRCGGVEPTKQRRFGCQFIAIAERSASAPVAI